MIPVPESIDIPPELPIKLRKEHCLQQTCLQYATAENSNASDLQGDTPGKVWGGTLAATDMVSECHRRKWLNFQVFLHNLQISTTRNARNLLPR